MKDLVLVLDFGGQYKELIARSVRSLKVYSEIRRGDISAEEIKKLFPIGIILTGGPNSVYADNALLCDPAIFQLHIPILCICYGMQLMCKLLGGTVKPCKISEYGKIKAELSASSLLFKNVKRDVSVLMSHTDYVSDLPPSFVNTAKTANCANAACENPAQKLYGVQFHPESGHTEDGHTILKNFLFDICNAKGDYLIEGYLQRQIASIQQTVGDEKVLLGLSGGVDSSVCAALISKAIGEKLTCIFVDHGFMRLQEGNDIEHAFADKKINFIRVNAKERFLSKIKGVRDPEKKRKIIGAEFARVFEEQAQMLGDIPFLAQGTIYPDVIESGGAAGAVIKSHHNVGGMPKNLSFSTVIEPLAGLFKDEVRVLGEKLGLPQKLVYRQPFPGPGLSIRIIGEVTEEKIGILQRCDHILCEEMSKIRKKPEQYFMVLTDSRSVGVKGDSRTYDYVAALRAVTTNDFMTCEYARLSHNLLSKISSRIVNEVREINRVVYDITGKPPATVEWE